MTKEEALQKLDPSVRQDFLELWGLKDSVSKLELERLALAEEDDLDKKVALLELALKATDLVKAAVEITKVSLGDGGTTHIKNVRELKRLLLKLLKDVVKALTPPPVIEHGAEWYYADTGSAGARGGRFGNGAPNPHNTGPRSLNNNLHRHGAQLGFNLGGMKGGGGLLGGDAGSSYRGAGSQGDHPAGGGGYGTGYGGGGGLGHDNADGSGSGGGGPKPKGGSKEGGQSEQVRNDSTGQMETPQQLPSPDPTQQSQAPTAAPEPSSSPEQDDSKDNSHGTSADEGEWQPSDQEVADFVEASEQVDPKGGGSEPNPDDGSDESGRMRGLPRYVPRRADTFTGKGAAPAQTALVYRLLAFSSAGLGEDGGGVNPHFFGADPSSDRSTGRGARAADPESGGGYTVGATPVNGGDTIAGMQGPGNMSDEADSAAITPTGPDPDNEWGAGGYNPHYQPAGYAWTPYSRGGAGGTSRAAPALPARVSRVAAIRFK